MKIIGLTGAAGAGKDTACAFALEWCEDHGLTAERLAFADPLKVSAARSLGVYLKAEGCIDFCNNLKEAGSITITRDTGDIQAEYSISGREFLQWYGTEAHRDVFGADFWVEVTERKLAERAGTELDVVFITDCRFANEAAMVNKHDGEVWEVVRSKAAAVTAHSSEAGLPDGAIEFQIDNNGSLEDLETLIGSVCESNLKEAA